MRAGGALVRGEGDRAIADTVFVDTITLTAADWFNDVNRLHYTILSDPADVTAVKTALGFAEGAWTPVLTFATPGNLAVTYSTQVGRYVKRDKVVHATCNITTSAFTHTTASGLLQVTGLPFTSLNTTGVVNYGPASFQGITKASYTQVTPEVNPNGTTVLFGASGSAQTFSGVAAADMPTGGSVILRFAVTYCI